jgi:hypothetical protein
MERREEEAKHKSVAVPNFDKPMKLLAFLFEGGKDHMESDRLFFEKPEQPID